MQRAVSFLTCDPKADAGHYSCNFKPGPTQEERNKANNGESPFAAQQVEHDGERNPYKKRAQQEVGQNKNAKNGDGSSDVWLFDTAIVLPASNVDYFGQL